jgi:alkylglycerol monooxygenase
MANLILYAVPFFALFIIWELVQHFISDKELYKFHDTIVNLSCGLFSQVSDTFLKFIGLYFYALVLENFAIFDFSDGGWLIWCLVLVLFDFLYYWFHRCSHRLNLFWMFHVVHHQSEEYNLSVALRQSAFGGLVSWVFYIPLALIGVPVWIYVATYSINLLYQFWIHTKVVDRMGFLEKFMNTPSHHRVHHGYDKEYLDKNYAGMFIVWDRMFGTFEEEVKEPRYGLLSQQQGWSVLGANVAPVVSAIKGCVSLSDRRDRIKFWFKGPGWQPTDKLASDPADRALLHDREILHHPEWHFLNWLVLLSFFIAIGLAISVVADVFGEPISTASAIASLVLLFWAWSDSFRST